MAGMSRCAPRGSGLPVLLRTTQGATKLHRTALAPGRPAAMGSNRPGNSETLLSGRPAVRHEQHRARPRAVSD